MIQWHSTPEEGLSSSKTHSSSSHLVHITHLTNLLVSVLCLVPPAECLYGPTYYLQNHKIHTLWGQISWLQYLETAGVFQLLPLCSCFRLEISIPMQYLLSTLLYILSCLQNLHFLWRYLIHTAIYWKIILCFLSGMNLIGEPPPKCLQFVSNMFWHPMGVHTYMHTHTHTQKSVRVCVCVCLTFLPLDIWKHVLS